METGGLLLIDEISLANDSVLERLNSVFEAERTLVISEKSSTEAVRIIAHEKFNMVATMNPSGDFGKKELSPALRNRMTELWVDSYFHQEAIITLYKNIPSLSIIDKIDRKVDLYLIIYETCVDKLSMIISNKADIEALAVGIFNMIGHINFILTQKYFAL